MPPPEDPHRVLKDITAGAVGGVAQVLTGQPFDTVKVRLQTQSLTAPEYNGVLDATQKIFRTEGPFAFYRGTLTPLLGIGACVSVQFFVLEWMKRSFTSFNRKKAVDGQETGLGTPQLILSGAAAGLSNSFIAGPVENVRIRLQVQKPGTQLPGYTYYSGPLDAFRSISRNHGLRGVFHGQVPTIAREIVGYGAYFGVYEFLVQSRLKSLSTADRAALGSGWSMLFGALSGFCFWLACYPLDVVKSKIQVDSMDKGHARYNGMLDAFRQTWKTEGAKGFTRGLGACMARAAPANAATFVAFESALKWLNENY